MATKIARMDAVPVAQVSTLTPTAANTTVYTLAINTKQLATYTSDASGTVQEIVEALQPLLDATVDSTTIPEATEVDNYTEDNTKITATGLSTGKPFTITNTGAGTITIATPTPAKSPNHWIAENFSSAGLPANNDTVIISDLSESQSILYGLDQAAVTLDLLDIRANSAALVGLDEFDDLGYYQYRTTHLTIGADSVRIGDGPGDGSRRINLALGTAATNVTIIKTASFGIGNDSPVHITATNSSNLLHMLSGIVDIATKPGTTSEWATFTVQGGTLSTGYGCIINNVVASGNAVVNLLSADPNTVTQLSTEGSAIINWMGDADITVVKVNGGKITLIATADIVVATLYGYSGKELDLSFCEAPVTITNGFIYATPDDPFVIRDPNNKLTMTNPFTADNGAGSLNLISGPSKTIKFV